MTACAKSTEVARQCAECGMAQRAETPRCWLCGHNLRVSAPAAHGRRRAVLVDGPFQFQLDSLLLTSGLLCVWLSLARVAPRETLATLLVVVIAYLRTALRVRDWQASGARVTVGQKLAWFATSLAIATAIASAAATAAVLFTGVGLGVGRLVEWWREEDLAGVMWFVLGAAAGLFAGVAAAVWATLQLWAWPAPEADDRAERRERLVEGNAHGS